jgi:ABC-2 type transport system ATP-binding protein
MSIRLNDANTLVQVENLRKRYGEFSAVDGVSFQIRQGEIFGLLGPNGAGKTTTISMLAGILAPTEGDIRVAGHDVRQASAAIKQTLGVVPQELAIYPKLTGRENLAFFGQLYGLQGAALLERIEAVLELVGLSDRADSLAETYSGGMKRRLNLAAGLMHRPQLLLLDEPTVGVDPQSRNHIFEGVRALNQQGLTILYTSHYMEEVEALCDRVGIMDRGRLIACDTVPNLIARMGGAVIEVSIAGIVSESLAQRLAQIEFVQAVERLDSAAEEGATRLHALTEHPHRALPGLVAALHAENLSLHALNIKQPNLEDVFLALTGKTLRD